MHCCGRFDGEAASLTALRVNNSDRFKERSCSIDTNDDDDDDDDFERSLDFEYEVSVNRFVDLFSTRRASSL